MSNVRVVLRTVREEPLFLEQLAKIEPDVQRADEFLEGVVWLLSREPGYGTQIQTGSSVWAVPAVFSPAMNQLTVYYTFDNNQVYLLSIVNMTR